MYAKQHTAYLGTVLALSTPVYHISNYVVNLYIHIRTPTNPSR